MRNRERKARNRGKQFDTPGRWSPEATIDFYNRYDGNFDLMFDVVETFDYVVSPAAFVAKIIDFVLKTHKWRNPDADEMLKDVYCVACGAKGDVTRLTMWNNRPYCYKHIVKVMGN